MTLYSYTGAYYTMQSKLVIVICIHLSSRKRFLLLKYKRRRCMYAKLEEKKY